MPLIKPPRIGFVRGQIVKQLRKRKKKDAFLTPRRLSNSEVVDQSHGGQYEITDLQTEDFVSLKKSIDKEIECVMNVSAHAKHVLFEATWSC